MFALDLLEDNKQVFSCCHKHGREHVFRMLLEAYRNEIISEETYRLMSMVGDWYEIAVWDWLKKPENQHRRIQVMFNNQVTV